MPKSTQLYIWKKQALLRLRSFPSWHFAPCSHHCMYYTVSCCCERYEGHVWFIESSELNSQNFRETVIIFNILSSITGVLSVCGILCTDCMYFSCAGGGGWVRASVSAILRWSIVCSDDVTTLSRLPLSYLFIILMIVWRVHNARRREDGAFQRTRQL